MGKKIVSVFMSVVLTVGLMPLPAMAETGSLQAESLQVQNEGDVEVSLERVGDFERLYSDGSVTLKVKVDGVGDTGWTLDVKVGQAGSFDDNSGEFVNPLSLGTEYTYDAVEKTVTIKGEETLAKLKSYGGPEVVSVRAHVSAEDDIEIDAVPDWIEVREARVDYEMEGDRSMLPGWDGRVYEKGNVWVENSNFPDGRDLEYVVTGITTNDSSVASVEGPLTDDNGEKYWRYVAGTYGSATITVTYNNPENLGDPTGSYAFTVNVSTDVYMMNVRPALGFSDTARPGDSIELAVDARHVQKDKPDIPLENPRYEWKLQGDELATLKVDAADPTKATVTFKIPEDDWDEISEDVWVEVSLFEGDNAGPRTNASTRLRVEAFNLDTSYTDMYFGEFSGVVDDRMNGMNPNYHVVPVGVVAEWLGSLKVRVGGEFSLEENEHNGELLVLGDDYTVSYYEADPAKRTTNPQPVTSAKVGSALAGQPTTPGSYLLQIDGQGKYVNCNAVYFDIQGSASDVSVAAIPDQTFAGKAVTPKLTVTYKGQPLTEGVHYQVAYSNNAAAGTGRATITGCSPIMHWGFDANGVTWTPDKSDRFLTGSKTVTFNIVKPAEDSGQTESQAATGPAVGEKVSSVETGTGLTADATVTGDDAATLTKATTTAKKVSIDTVSVSGTPVHVTKVSANALKGSKATSVTVGDSVEELGAGSLSKMTKLTSLKIGKGLKKAGKNVLKGSKVKKVTLKSSQLDKKNFSNLFKGSKVKTVKLKGVSKKVKKNYKKWAKALKITVK